MLVATHSGALLTQAEFHGAIARKSATWFAACLRITRSRELAEDAVQDGLLQAWNKRHQFHGDAALETWIHRIAVNAALHLLRKQRPQTFAPLEIDVESADDGDSPEARRSVEDLDDQLATALRRLTDLERVCFVLKHLEEWKLDEIAEELGTNISAVKQALFRGVKKLRVSMADLRDS
jgi:RNA polymerase sigma-70 factor (ECF subfamily)